MSKAAINVGDHPIKGAIMKKGVTTILAAALLACLAQVSAAQEKKVKSGLTPEDWAYKIAEGVMAKEVTYFSDGVGCYVKIFYPKGFSASGKTPGVVLGQGWAGTHFSIEKYGARFAERGLVALVIDYRGWGSSDPFIAQAQPTVTAADPSQALDGKRIIKTKMDVVLKRMRLLPLKMVEDYRPFHHLKAVGDRPVLFVVAEKEELMNNRDHAYAALEVLTGPKKLISVPEITHFEMYINEPFEISSNAAANWFREHLGLAPIPKG